MVVVTTASNYNLANMGISGNKVIKTEVIKTSLLIYFRSVNDFIKSLSFV